jgi:ATP-dependent protease ClpP protease subunit
VPNWQEVLREIQIEQHAHNTVVARETALTRGAVDTVRRRYLAALNQKTKRNVIAYYSAFLSKSDVPCDITDEDKNGFMMAVHGLTRDQRALGLDLILHTPGGSIAATESLVDYLRRIFGRNIRAIIPQMAMSAGTMVACSCSKILMARHANLGPIDPHLRNLPAHGVIAEFRKAAKEIKKDPSKAYVWQPIISQYPPAFLGQCINAIVWSNKFVRSQLKTVMFHGHPDAEAKAKTIVRKLSSSTRNRTHNRHIHFDECQEIGLDVSLIEDDQELQDLVLTVHHCFMHTLMNTDAFKIIENHLGAALVKRQQVMTVKQS